MLNADRAARRAIPDVETLIGRGELAPLRNWLRANVHQRGRQLPLQALMLEATAEHGQVLLELRQLDSARDAFEELQRRAGDDDPEIVTLATAELGAVARLQGDIDLARERFESAGALASARGDVVGQIDVLRLQGWSEITAGRPRAALPRLERAHALEKTVPGPGRQGETLRLLGWSEFLAGDIAQARAHLWEAMAEAHAVDDVGSVGWCFGLLAHTLLFGGQITRCLEVARNLREVAQRNGDPWAEWTCATLEAAALLGLGEVDEAHAQRGCAVGGQRAQEQAAQRGTQAGPVRP